MQEESLKGEPPVVLMEMTLRNLQVGETINPRDFLDRVDTLSALGKTVLISDFLRFHRLVAYLSRYTQKPIGLPIGLARLRDVLDEKFYTTLEGGLMESLGQLFKNGARVYVYPSLDRKTGKLITLENLEVPPHLRHLFAHLVENRFVESIRKYNPDCLAIYSGDVLQQIQSGDAALGKTCPAADCRGHQNQAPVRLAGKMIRQEIGPSRKPFRSEFRVHAARDNAFAARSAMRGNMLDPFLPSRRAHQTSERHADLNLVGAALPPPIRPPELSGLFPVLGLLMKRYEKTFLYLSGLGLRRGRPRRHPHGNR